MTKKDALNKVLILNGEQIAQKITRIAYQILEDNLDEKEIILAGMGVRGFVLAERMQLILKGIATFEVNLLNVQIAADYSVSVLDSQGQEVHVRNKVIVLVDDVLNSGKTLSFGFSAFLNDRQKKIRTAVLIDRSHKAYPISTDFVGLSLATVLKEHIEVSLHDQKDLEGVYLS